MLAQQVKPTSRATIKGFRGLLTGVKQWQAAADKFMQAKYRKLCRKEQPGTSGLKEEYQAENLFAVYGGHDGFTPLPALASCSNSNCRGAYIRNDRSVHYFKSLINVQLDSDRCCMQSANLHSTLGRFDSRVASRDTSGEQSSIKLHRQVEGGSPFCRQFDELESSHTARKQHPSSRKEPVSTMQMAKQQWGTHEVSTYHKTHAYAWWQRHRCEERTRRPSGETWCAVVVITLLSTRNKAKTPAALPCKSPCLHAYSCSSELTKLCLHNRNIVSFSRLCQLLDPLSTDVDCGLFVQLRCQVSSSAG